MARVTAKQKQLREAFVAVGIPTEQADNALAQFPTAEATQKDVDVLLTSVGYPAGYGTVKEGPVPAPTTAPEGGERS